MRTIHRAANKTSSNQPPLDQSQGRPIQCTTNNCYILATNHKAVVSFSSTNYEASPQPTHDELPSQARSTTDHFRTAGTISAFGFKYWI